MNIKPYSVECHLSYVCDNGEKFNRGVELPYKEGQIYQTPSLRQSWLQLVKLTLPKDPKWTDILEQLLKLIAEVESHGAHIGTIGIKMNLMNELCKSGACLYTTSPVEDPTRCAFRGIPVVIIPAAYWSEEFVLVATDYPNPIKLTQEEQSGTLPTLPLGQV